MASDALIYLDAFGFVHPLKHWRAAPKVHMQQKEVDETEGQHWPRSQPSPGSAGGKVCYVLPVGSCSGTHPSFTITS